MADTKYGIQHIWDPVNAEWVPFIPKASLALMEETPNRKIFTVGEQTKIANYLTTFNTKGKLVQLDSTTGKFDSSLMHVDDDIDMNNNAINGISALRFEDEKSRLFISPDEFTIHTGTNLLDISSAGKIELTALTGVDVNSGMTISGNISTKGGITLNGTGGSSRYIEGVHKISFLNANEDVAINAVPYSGASYGLEFTWASGSKTFSLQGNTATFNTPTKLKGLMAPTDSSDAANKAYVDQLVAQGTHVIAAARVATTDEININDSGLINAIDGVTLEAGDRVLVWKQETDPTENGVYIVNEGIQKWTKVLNDSDKGSLTFVLEGATHKGKQFYNTDGDTWEVFFHQDAYHAIEGGGLEFDITGYGIQIAEDGVTNAMLKGNIYATKIQRSDSFTDDIQLTIRNGGITADMLDGDIPWTKISPYTSEYRPTVAWTATEAPGASKTIRNHLADLYTAIRLLRGESTYNHPNNETIAGAYELAGNANTEALSRSKVFYRAAGASLPDSEDVGTLAAGMTAVLYQEVAISPTS